MYFEVIGSLASPTEGGEVQSSLIKSTKVLRDSGNSGKVL